MNVIIVGMRRSGTTILFDCLDEDSRFDSYYEPFCYGRINVGGGSRARKIPYGEKLNSARREFSLQRGLEMQMNEFNLGSRRDFKLEFEEEIPDVFRDYLKFLASKSKSTLMKFVRLSYKMKALYEIFPDAKIIHIHKDPRRAVMSHMLGRTRKRAKGLKKLKQSIKQWRRQKTFFSRKGGFDDWSAGRLINYVIETEPQYQSFKNSPAYEKTMLLWKILYDKTRRDGQKYFQSNYFEVTLEDLCNRPEGTLDSVYNFLGFSCTDSVKEWACSNIKSPRSIYREEDRRWFDTARKLGIELDS